MDSPAALRRHAAHHAGSPRTLHRAGDARPPHPPRAARCVRVLVASAPVAGFVTFGRLAAAIGVTRPNRVRCCWAHVVAHTALSGQQPGCIIARPDRPVSRTRLPSYAGPELHVERAIHMADTSQSARTIWVTLAQPKKRRRTGTNEGRHAADCLHAGRRQPQAGATGATTALRCHAVQSRFARFCVSVPPVNPCLRPPPVLRDQIC